LVCEQNDIWLAKLRQDFDGFKMLKPNPRDNYELLYKLTELKRKLDLKEDIYSLYELKELNLFDKQIREIPKEIGQLTNLQVLNLYGNQIRETPREILREIEQFPNLRTFYR